MKIRIGVGLGAAVGPAEYADVVDSLEKAGVDSLWLSEVVSAPQVDPVVGMTYALARTSHLKVGTGVAILPGRHPALVAKELVSLAGLAPGRVLPAFGLRPGRPQERDLFPVPGPRAAVFDEALRALRLLLREDDVSFDGEFFRFANLTIGPKPTKPLDIWLSGFAPAGLRRAGRYADGWLASFITPAEARHGRETIAAAAAEADRKIEDDHYGISLAVATDGLPPELVALARERRPTVDPAELVADGWSDARRMIDAYVEAGLTKFVVRPASVSGSYGEFLDAFVAELMPLQTR
ncbi:TIGR03854 family LLM class F420-dependent oxidoreductase [Fodinicola acaciae]|uniref:TIGR03854 family LLM class F420-dependent oxidoreductase n=1 Tax=Fodinicola acaciae TaxID=2681555 RepID=UPI0013D31828|nr:TIGR03854 family LLM class F420-dependent oxidoreductase [Fodinicola acaciae]